MQAVAVAKCIAGYRSAAGAVQDGQEGTLTGHRVKCRPMVDRRQQSTDTDVFGSTLYADGPLRRRRWEILRVENFGRHLGLAKPLQTGKGEQRTVCLAFGQLAQAGVYGAAEDRHVNVWAQPADQRLSSQRRRADGGSVWKVDHPLGGATDEGVANIFARQECREAEAIGKFGRHVLGRMDGEIEFPGQQLLFEFLGKKSLATDLRQ